MIMRVRLLITLLVLLLTACGGGDQPALPASNSNVTWDTSPSTIVFRADVTGGTQDPLLDRNWVPDCTIYGDGRLIWLNNLGVANTQVLEDQLTADQIRIFVFNNLAVNRGIYNYPDRSKQVRPATSDVQPVVEVLTLNVNGTLHITDAFAGWDRAYYDSIVTDCHALSLQPVLFVPTAAWVTAQPVAYDPRAAAVPWDAQANGLSLQETAASNDRRWVQGQAVGAMWNLIRTSAPDLVFYEGDTQYRVTVEVPNVTRDAPAAPG